MVQASSWWVEKHVQRWHHPSLKGPSRRDRPYWLRSATTEMAQGTQRRIGLILMGVGEQKSGKDGKNKDDLTRGICEQGGPGRKQANKRRQGDVTTCALWENGHGALWELWTQCIVGPIDMVHCGHQDHCEHCGNYRHGASWDLQTQYTVGPVSTVHCGNYL